MESSLSTANIESRLKRIRSLHWLLQGVTWGIPLILLVIFSIVPLSPSDWAVYSGAGIWFLLVVVVNLQYHLSRCPRCHHFFTTGTKMLQITLRRCGNCSLPLDIDEARAKIGSEPAQTIGPTGKTTEKIAREFGAQSNRRLHVWMMVLLIILLGLAITLKSPLLQSSNPFMVIAGVLGLLMTIVLVMHIALKKHLHTFSCPDCGTPIADFIETGNYGDIKYYCNKCDIVWNTRMHRPPDL